MKSQKRNGLDRTTRCSGFAATILGVIALVMLVVGGLTIWRANDNNVYSSMPWPKVCDEMDDEKEASTCRHTHSTLIANQRLGLVILGSVQISTALIMAAILLSRKK